MKRCHVGPGHDGLKEGSPFEKISDSARLEKGELYVGPMRRGTAQSEKGSRDVIDDAETQVASSAAGSITINSMVMEL